MAIGGVGRALWDVRIARACEVGAPAVGLHTAPTFGVSYAMVRGRGWRRERAYDFVPAGDLVAEAWWSGGRADATSTGASDGAGWPPDAPTLPGPAVPGGTLAAMHPGARVGRYALVSLLGRGGMGEVWEAVLHGPHGFRRTVALKLLPDLATHGDVAALLAEGRLGALLAHPNVVATHDLGEAQGHWYVAMELVRGPPVGELARSAPLSPAAVIDVGLQACAALAHVHALEVDGRRAGLVHRDVKPSNLLVDRWGTVKLADLGIARLAGTRGAFAGTPGYAPPEQVAGAADERSDLFALGVTLLALATRRLPFGKGPAACAAVAEVEHHLPRIRALADGALAGLGDVVARCLRADPEARWPDADTLADALRTLSGSAGGPPLVAHAGVAGSAGAETPASATPTVRVRRLPLPRDRFLGREDLRDEVQARVTECAPLVTLLGPGGVGKTRLALEVAHGSVAALAGGAFFCDLADARTPAGLCAGVAAALGVRLDRTDPAEQLGWALAARGRTLLVLDNLEQAVDAAREVVGRWLEAAPEATFLATSRIALRLRSERIVPVAPLDGEAATDLFVDRATRPVPAASRPLVRTIVDRLDRLPLAIELAAARTRTLPLDTLLARLEDRFRVLAGGATDRPERHRSVRASLDASWDLLGGGDRDALSACATFAGSFSAEAAEAVLAPSDRWALDAIEGLVDASLLQVEGDRFRMLETVQAYARERADRRVLAAAEVRHGRWYAQLGDRAALSALDGPARAGRIATLAAERENLLAAARRATARRDARVALHAARAAMAVIAESGPLDAGLDVARAVAAAFPELPAARALHARTAWVAGCADEAREAARALDGEASTEAELLVTRHLLAFDAGRTDEARAHLDRALALALAAHDRLAEAKAWLRIGTFHGDLGRLAEAQAAYERTIRLASASGAAHLEATALGNLGTLLRQEGRLEEARAALERAHAQHRALGHRRYEGLALGSLANVLGELGRTDEALAVFDDALATIRATGDRRYEAVVLVNVGVLLRMAGRSREARERLGQALALARATGGRRFEAIALLEIGGTDLEGGDARSAEAAAGAALAIAAPMGDSAVTAAALVLSARVALVERRYADALQALDHAEPLAEEARHRNLRAQVLCARAEAAAASGDGPAAAAALAGAEALVGASGRVEPWLAAAVRAVRG